MINIRNLGSKESLGVKFKEGICAKLCLKLCFESDWYFCNITKSGWNNHFLKSLQKQPYADVQFKIGVFKNFPVFPGKHLCWNLFFKKNPGLQVCSFVKKRLQHRCFFTNIEKFLRTPILKNIWERLLLTVCLERFPASIKNIRSEKEVFLKIKPKNRSKTEL